MFAKLINRKEENKINGCHITKPSSQTADFPFCSDIIKLDEENQMGVEFNWNDRIRIDGIITTDQESLFTMLDALQIIARRYGYPNLYYADELSKDVLTMLMTYGFTETQVYGDNTNHYLDYTVEQKKSIWAEER